ncbi:hypothetical protein L1887_44491 [Cichorium endivia]|nr:hypothetical protein L1887_44491 [Cichorium endivia]
MELEGASIPPNYISILQLKERWLQQNHQNPAKSNPQEDEANSQPNGEAALRRVPRQRPNRLRVKNQIIPDAGIDDSGSKAQVDAADNHPKGEKEDHKTDHSNSKLSKKKKSSRALKPRSVTDQNPNGGGSPQLVPEAVKEKKQTQHVGGRRSRHQKEPNDRMTPFAHNVDDLSQNDDGVVETVAATMNVPIVSQGANRRGGAGRYQVKPKSKPSSDQKMVCEPNELSRSDAGGHGIVKAVAAAVNIPIVNQEANRRRGAGRFQGKPRPKSSSGSNRPCESLPTSGKFILQEIS